MDWTLANPLSISLDADNTQWHTGRCVDVLPLGGGKILVASETGGVWSVDGMFQASPLSNDWLFPDVNCLAQGPLGPNHLFAGTNGALFETDPTRTDVSPATGMVFSWHQIGLPVGMTVVNRIAFTRAPGGLPGHANPHVAVIAGDAGVRWSTADTPGQYWWTLAIGGSAGGYFSVAASSAGVIAGVTDGSADRNGIYVGQFNMMGCVLVPAVLPPGLDVRQMRNVSVAVCATQPSQAYAIAADAKGRILTILSSSDGGKHWQSVGMQFDAAFHGKDEFVSFFGDAGSGGPHKTISVHPLAPQVVAFSWLRAAVSWTGGASWTPIGGDWDPVDGFWKYDDRSSGLHEDTHAVVFDPSFVPDRIYIASDGGVAVSDSWRQADWHFHTYVSRNLANLQFNSPTVRSFYATLDAASLDTLIGGGLQDNGSVWCHVDVNAQPTPWREADGGDGGWVAFVDDRANQALFTRLNDQADGNPAMRHHWDYQNFHSDGTIPLRTSTGGRDDKGLREAFAERAAEPRWRPGSATGTRVAVAVGRVFKNSVIDGGVPADAEIDHVAYGLHTAGGVGPANYLDWWWITTLDPTIGGVRAVGTDRFGDTTWVGTDTGRTFIIDNSTGVTTEIAVEKPATGLGVLGRIVSYEPGSAYAIMQSGDGGVVLELVGLEFKIVAGAGSPPFERFFALDYNPHGWRGGIDLAVATDTSVFLRKADDRSWFVANSGLPLVPHCSDLRFVRWNGQTVLFLSTYGRSVWMCHVPDGA